MSYVRLTPGHRELLLTSGGRRAIETVCSVLRHAVLAVGNEHLLPQQSLVRGRWPLRRSGTER